MTNHSFSCRVRLTSVSVSQGEPSILSTTPTPRGLGYSMLLEHVESDQTSSIAVPPEFLRTLDEAGLRSRALSFKDLTLTVHLDWGEESKARKEVRVVYVTDDGAEFENPEEAELYERKRELGALLRDHPEIDPRDLSIGCLVDVLFENYDLQRKKAS